jgi:uncharacterized protein (TIGR00106 family)
MSIVAVSMAPAGVGTSLSSYVAAAQRVLQADGRVKFRLDPMFTTIEGDLAVIFELIQKMEEAMFALGAQRVGTVIKIDSRRDKVAHMEDKVHSVEEKIPGL